MKVLEEHIGKNLQACYTKYISNKRKNDKLDYIKVKICASKNTFKKSKKGTHRMNKIIWRSYIW